MKLVVRKPESEGISENERDLYRNKELFQAGRTNVKKKRKRQESSKSREDDKARVQSMQEL